MERILRAIFYGAWFMPHGHCYLWQPRLVGLHVISDVLIGTAYVLISLVLYALVRRIRLPFSTMIVAFGVFIGGGILRRQKRGRPDTWLYRQLQWRIATRYPLVAGWIGGHVLITRSGRWSNRRAA